MAVHVHSGIGTRRSQGASPNANSGATAKTSAMWWTTRTVKKAELNAHSGDT